jgi:hypothetical protein
MVWGLTKDADQAAGLNMRTRLDLNAILGSLQHRLCVASIWVYNLFTSVEPETLQRGDLVLLALLYG